MIQFMSYKPLTQCAASSTVREQDSAVEREEKSEWKEARLHFEE